MDPSKYKSAIYRGPNDVDLQSTIQNVKEKNNFRNLIFVFQ